MCHSLELVRQQRIPRETWLAELKKMRGWGALVAAKDVDQLADFLSTRYGPSAAPYQPARISAAAAQADGRIDFNAPPARGDAANGEKLYGRACAQCHGIDARGVVGPNLLQRPILYEPHQWNEIVLKGLRRMPPFRDTLSKSDSEDILVWLRGLSVRRNLEPGYRNLLSSVQDSDTHSDPAAFSGIPARVSGAREESRIALAHRAKRPGFFARQPRARMTWQRIT